jgi:ribulose-bisphosphate carboxylase large chain
VIYPNYGGRFSFSEEECKQIARGCLDSMLEIKTIFPIPGGGMSLNKVPNIIDFYGSNLIILIGGDLHRNGKDLLRNTQEFRNLIENL